MHVQLQLNLWDKNQNYLNCNIEADKTLSYTIPLKFQPYLFEFKN